MYIYMYMYMHYTLSHINHHNIFSHTLTHTHYLNSNVFSCKSVWQEGVVWAVPVTTSKFWFSTYTEGLLDQHSLYCIAGNLRERKPLWISQFYSHPQKFSPQNFRHATPIYVISLTFRDNFLHKMLHSYWSMKVSPSNGFHYTVHIILYMCTCTCRGGWRRTYTDYR